MGLNATMGIAISGMNAAQLGMDVTGQNISNVNTEGYSRKILTLTANARYDQEFGQMGFGVDVSNIARMRDSFIDGQICDQTQTKSYYEQINSALEEVENIFTEPQDTGLSTYLDNFWNSWQDLANNPSDYASRRVVQSNAQVLVDVIHNLAGGLRDLRSSRNDLIEENVKKVNELIKEIYNLNLEIKNVEISQENANDSRDKRDQLIKELSKYIDVTTQEDQFGAISVSSAGFMLISPVDYNQIEVYTTNFTNTDGTTRLDYGLRIGLSKKDYMPLDGAIKGLFIVRDEVVPYYQDQLDKLVYWEAGEGSSRIEGGLVAAVNALHSNGYDLNGFTGTNFFDPLKVTATDIDLSAAIKQSVLNIAAASGGTDVAGTATITDPVLGTASSLGQDDIKQGSVEVSVGGTVLTEGAGEDYVIDYLAGTITMLNNLYTVPPQAAVTVDVTFRYQVAGTKGPGDGSNALAIAQLRQQKTMSANYMYEETATFGEFYNSIMGTLGVTRNEAMSNVDSRDFLVRYLEKQQDSVAGVSLDEEMANMVKFEHSFSAAARLISVVDQMMDTIIKM